jgi:selenocysteine lyase/cysteine desulfurase
MNASASVPPSRALFDIPRDVVYLNCANMSPQLRTVSDAGRRAVDSKARPWTMTSDDWFSPSERLRGLAGRLLNAPADDIAIVSSVSYGMAVAAANVTVGRGQSIVLLDNEFPSSVYVWRALAERKGGLIRTVGRDPGTSWTEKILAALDDGVAVVVASQCHWTDGTWIDLERVGARARQVGAALVVDASQSLGVVPLDVERITPDFVASVGYKWLLGPYGLGYLYVAPRHARTGTPLEHSWLTRSGREDFARLTDYTEALTTGARRFDMGEYPQFALTPMAIAALEQILEWGVGSIQRRLTALTCHLQDRLQDGAVWSMPDTECAGHMTAIGRAGGVSDDTTRTLRNANVYISRRGDRLRISPHLYNDESDIDALVDVLYGRDRR